MKSQTTPPGQIQISIRTKSTLSITVVYLLLFITLFFLFNLVGEYLVRANAPNLLGTEATPELIQRILDTLHSQLNAAMIVMFTVSYLVINVIVITIGYGMSRPLDALTRYAERVEMGDYTPMSLPKAGRFRDEITILTETLVSMVDKVEGREQSLKQKVVELQIVIDQSRTAQQVEEITDNEFFSNLKARAHELRQSGTASTAGSTEPNP